MAQRKLWSAQPVRNKQASPSRAGMISDVEDSSRQLLGSLFAHFGMTLRVVSEATYKPVMNEQWLYLDRWVQAQLIFFYDLSVAWLGC